MVNYLAVDFGTSNCLAGHLVLVDGTYKLRLFELEEGSDCLPSLIFVRQTGLPPYEIDEQTLEKEVLNEIERDKDRHSAALREVEERVDAYYRMHSPRVKRPDPKNYLANSEGWKRAVQRYEIDSRSLPSAIDRFKSGPLQLYRQELLGHVRPLKDCQVVRSQIRSKMVQREFERRSHALWEKTFFSALNDDSMETLYGSEALLAYAEDPLSGFFLRSPKAFLAAALHSQHRELFIKAISKMLREVRMRAEFQSSTRFDGIIMGRPVNFMGSEDADANERAVGILKTAAQRAGFAEVRFVYEPLAAALAVRRKLLETDHPILIVDIGGGTTDVAYLRVLRSQRVDFDVQAVGGERVGGNDFDLSIARGKCSRYLGKGVRLRSGRVVPMSILDSGLNTLSIQDQLMFRRSGEAIEDFLANSCDQDTENLCRLREMYIRQLQHRVILTCEAIKQKLSSQESLTAEFDFFQNPFEFTYSTDSFMSDCEANFSKILLIVGKLLGAVQGEEIPVRAIFTGGMSQQPRLVDAIRRSLPPGSMVESMPPLRSVVGGLAIVAHELNRVSSANVEPDVVRGIPIMEV